MDSCCASQQICCLPGLLAAWLYMRTITRDCMTDDSSRAQMIDRESAPGRLEPAAVSLSRSSAHGWRWPGGCDGDGGPWPAFMKQPSFRPGRAPSICHEARPPFRGLRHSRHKSTYV
jgi:hypothetical protein